MVRETRHLWVGNLPENIREDRIREHFKRYGRVQSVKLLPRVSEEKTGEVSMACTVAFMDIKSASKAHNAELKIDDRTLNTEYYEPAAIPSAASPQGTPPPYSTSPGSTRFPNGHGSSDEHGFADAAPNSTRFYERSSSTGGSGVSRTPSDAPSEPSRRGAATPAPEGGSGTCRGGRNRDRFRGGGHRGGASWVSGYEPRYNNSNERSQSETTGYNSAPSDTNERRNSESVRKKAKSRSGSRSPTPNGSTSSRSPSRSRSRSSSSSSSSSTSRDTSSTSSRRSRRHRHRKKAGQGATDDRRPLAICVRNLPVRSSDTSLKDGLFHEYKKHGKVTWVKVVGQNADRYAIVCFKKPEDAEKALEVSYDKLFFGCKIEVAPYAVCEVDDGEYRYESEIDEYNPKATRTLFIGNLEKDVTASDLRKHFDQFGEIIEIDIKKQGAVSSYAFCQYADIVSVVKAIRKMDGEHLGNNRVKLGFGKSMAYNCVWVDGIIETVTEKNLRSQFEHFGTIPIIMIDREKGQALVFYENVAQAQQAVAKMRGFMMKGQKLQVDFASRECQAGFCERVQKPGATLDRGTFEDRREASSRGFESSAVSRLSRYDTPTRPRTSSYSSRSSVAAVASPGTPGSATPRAGRTRVSRYYDYDMDYGTIEGRHTTHRSYDEYSQGSAASHEDIYDPYDHGVYLHDSPGHLDPLEVRVQNLVETVPYAPHDIRNLQKERVHLLEQLEECPSSGDELICPKKRLKLDLLDPSITGDVIIETNRDHNRKVMEVRRLSETTLRHHSRRPSVDNKYGNHYTPRAVGCKRRRTGGSDGGTRTAGHSHYAEHSDGSEHGGSRPGTPLCDENPEFPPGEPPKRTTREREGPLMLPLPKFAAQIRSTPEFQRGTVSVAGIKGQKDHVNPLASPPPAATSPRVSHHVRPPSPTHAVPPPASPPPRPPSLSSNSSDSDGTPPSPSLEERIRSLDEKYEKWSGSRALSAAGNDALALLDANREKFRLRHKLLEIQDLTEVQPSEIVKSVMAKPSVFDEDLKRLESVGEKYEPKEFGFCLNRQVIMATSMASAPPTPTPPLSVSSSTLKLATTAPQTPKTPTVLSPRSSGTGVTIPATRGLQYPFPSHPPVQMSPVPVSTTAPTTPTTSTTVAVRNANPGENRLKPTASAPGDSRTSSVKNSSVANVSGSIAKSKSSEKVSSRRNSSNTSPRADVKTRRNSDTSARRIEEAEQEEKERQEKERREREIELEKQRFEKERLERERLERERVQREKEKAEKERQERIRQEKERVRAEKEKLERERQEKDRQEKEKQEKERLERLALERLQHENEERERKEREERERKEKEERERKERERREREERELQEKLERERREREEQEQEQKVKEEEHRASKEKERRRSEDPNRHKDVDNHHERVNKQLRENHTENKHRENNTHHANGKDESHRRDVERPRHTTETRHLSIDLEKGPDPSRRKERNNSLPAAVGVKRRPSSHDQISDIPEEAKKMRFTHDHKKIPERRDSKDSTKSDEKIKKNKHKNNSHDKHSSTKESEERRREREREREERHKKYKLEKQKAKSKSREKEAREPPSTPPAVPTLMDKDFLAKLNLKSNKDIERDKQRKEKEIKEKRVGDVEERLEDKRLDDKIKKDKPPCFDAKDNTKSPQNEMKVKMEDRKGLEKHSIFEIVNEEPPYISMYDKVKARSCKNMQKQEEEKRQEKIKAKFNQLKLSRARREEKKRSTSWEEDSDSDKDVEVKSRRCRKVLESSDESQDRKVHHRGKDQLHSDSDNSLPVRTVKTEQETTDDDIKAKHLPFKASKSRITSDTSDEEYEKSKVSNKIISLDNHYKKVKEIFSENEQEIEYTDNEIDMLVNPYPLLFKKSSDEEIAVLKEIRKDKLERRKKHKKKQKKQKHSISSEESYKLEPEFNQIDEKEKKHHEKKKDHSKKDKRRDKTREGRDKTKKSKKNKSEEKSESKREGKMENIFGSLSEDSESGQKEQKPFLTDENAQELATFNADSEKESEITVHDDRESEHKRKKEKKRKEKERRLQEAAAEAAAAAAEEPPNSNDNSMDFADMGKQLEANIKDDTSEMEYKAEVENSNLETSDTFTFAEHEIKKEKEDRKEGKEKKKKRKKSKDEKKHHHHYHSDKNKSKSIEPKSEKIIETVPPEEMPEVKVEPADDNSFSQVGHCQSLPTLLDVSPSAPKSPTDFEISPSTRNIGPLISPIPNTPTTIKPTKEKLIPGFGTEIDEAIHENAVKSICNDFEPVNKTEEPTVIKEENKESTVSDAPDDKPRVVISQEETEDAVAALLGESFGSNQFEERYTEDISAAVEETPPEMVEESNVQDDEEMRKAVQSLEADDDITKPDTPQSEHELQIDTDTEEQEDAPSTVEQRPKTPEIPTVTETKTPETPFFQEKSTIPSSVPGYKSLGSPPSLTPLKTGPAIFAEAKKSLEKTEPTLPEKQHRSVIAQTWSADRKDVIVSNAAPVTEVKSPAIVSSATSQTLLKTFVTPSTVKVSEPNYPPLAKLSPTVEIKIPSPSPSQPTVATKPPVISQLHNLPARSPVQICKPPTSEGILSPKASTNIHLNRMPITPVIVSKPIQATAIYLPQPKVAHSTEPPKLVSTSDLRPQDRPRMVLQTSYGNYSQGQPPRMVVQTNYIPPGGLLVPSRHIAPVSYGQFVTNVPHSANTNYSVKEAQNPETINKSPCSGVVVDQVKSTIVIAGSHGAPGSPRTTLSTSVVMNPPQLILTSPKAIQNNSTLSPRSCVSAKSPTASQAFVVLPPPRQSPKPIHVITESHPIVADTTDRNTVIPSPPALKVPLLDGVTRPKIPEIKSTNTLTVAVQESRTSTPSPVIVPNPDIKIENSPINISKLAIEKVTEELNLSLEKNDIDQTIKEEIKADESVIKEETKDTIIAPEKITDSPVKVHPTTVIESTKESEVIPEKRVEEKVETVDQITETQTKCEKDDVKIQKDEDSLETKEDKEDNDFWSANSVNIDSVIKTLGSADEMSDTDHKEPQTSPCIKSDKEKETQEDIPSTSPENKTDEISETKAEEESDINETSVEAEEDIKSEPSVTRSSARRGRGGRPRGSKTKTNIERGGIQTRRGKLKEILATTGSTIRRGRGGKMRTERKSSKSESDSAANDVYEFRDDSDDNNKEQRPRLVLTIKSTTSSTSNLQTTAIVKEITRDGAKEIGKETKDSPPAVQPAKPAVESKEEFSSPQTNTRKSRRLAEKDVTRNTVDDTIEDVIKNTPQTRSAAGQRRSGRQVKKPQPLIAEQDTPRKSPRGRKPLRRGSEAAETSSSEETREEQQKPVDPPIPKLLTQTTVTEVERPREISPQPEPKKVDHCSLKTAMLKRFKGEMNSLGKPEPTNLIDPVTGVLTPMRESEEGKYIPLPGTSPGDKKSEQGVVKSGESNKTPTNIITQPHQVTVVQQSVPKVHPLKAHVLSSQAAKAVIEQVPQIPVASQPMVIVNSSTTSAVITRSGTPVTQNTNTISGNIQTVGPLSPRPGVPVAVTSKPQVKPPVLSPSQQLLLTTQKHLLSAREQHLSQQQPTGHISSSLPTQQVQMINTHIAHIKHRHDPQVILGAKGSSAKAAHQPHLSGPVAASPPITKGQTSRIIQGPSQASNKGVMEPPKVDVNFGLGRPSLSPSGPQARLPGLPVAAYEASLIAETRAYYNKSRSPPPAHQNSPHSPKGEPMPHFQPGSLRPALNPAHYMHQQQVMQYQQFLRQQQLHFQRPTNLEKSGEEGEEAPVGLLSGRGAAVPHHSPHDRATESPAIGQVYNTLPHSARLPPYHPGTRYYEQQSAEPPPAHRPLTSHDRAGLPHIPPLGTADRPLGAHTAHSSSHLLPDRTPVAIPERPVSAHIVHDRTSLSTPERPHTAYGHSERPIVATGLGAAGNLMGAMAKHIGVDAPASQRGIQAATPPLASQVPPQAESLFMLLKQYPLLWQGLLALKNDQAAVQMYFVSGNEQVAKCSLPKNTDGSTPPLRIFQRMRLEQPQVEGVARKMQMENEHCMLLALPCGHDPIDVLKQSTNLNMGFITYLQLKQAAGIVNVAAPGTTQPPAYVVHIFPSCDFVNENLRRIAPSLLERVADIAHLLIVITTV